MKTACLSTFLFLAAGCGGRDPADGSEGLPGPAGGAAPASADPGPVPAAGGRATCTLGAEPLELLREVDNGHGSNIAQAVSDDGRLAVAAVDGSIKLWDLETGEQTAELSSSEEEFVYGTSFEGQAVVRALGWSGTGRWLLAGDDRGVVTRWNPIAGTIAGEQPMGESPVEALAVRSYSVLVAHAEYAGNVRVWTDAPNRFAVTVTEPVPTRLWNVHAVAWLPDGDFLLAGDEYGLRLIERWRVADGGFELIADWGGERPGIPEGSFVDLAVDDAGARAVAVAFDLQVFDLARLADGPIASVASDALLVALAADGSRIVTGGQGVVSVWDAELRPLGDSERTFYVGPIGVDVVPGAERVICADVDDKLRLYGCGD